jgi:hypothetical protein
MTGFLNKHKKKLAFFGKHYLAAILAFLMLALSSNPMIITIATK